MARSSWVQSIAPARRLRPRVPRVHREPALQPVAIETTALYRGRRQEAIEHLKLAREHGFTIDSVLAPLEILDGRHGERSVSCGALPTAPHG